MSIEEKRVKDVIEVASASVLKSEQVLLACDSTNETLAPKHIN
jgi:hypothetical protein